MSAVATPSQLHRAVRFYEAPIGKKVVVAITGIVLFGFVLGHLAGNLQVFLGAERLNHYAELLRMNAGLLWAARTPSWRLPLLAVGLLQYVLHAINHLADIDATEESAHGQANFAAIAVGAGFVALLMYAEASRRRGGPAHRDP